jgi:cellulose biosynthesis protein BcsQ
MKTIAIYHNKGGVGKTTTAVNLAAAFQNKGKRVLLIDIDAQANSTFSTGLIKFQFEEDDDLVNRNVFQLLESGEFNFIPEIVRKSNGFNTPEIDVVPAHISLIDNQDRLTKLAASRFRLNSKLQKVEDNYDITIIDAPPSRDIYAEIALIAAD